MVELHINIDVDDLAAAIRFYTEAFGFTVRRRLGPDMAELAGAPSPVYLLSKPSGSRPIPGLPLERRYDRHWTPLHFDVAVPKLEPALARAVAAGARLEEPISEHNWGRMAMLADPFGHGVCLIEFSERGYDALEDGG